MVVLVGTIFVYLIKHLSVYLVCSNKNEGIVEMKKKTRIGCLN